MQSKVLKGIEPHWQPQKLPVIVRTTFIKRFVLSKLILIPSVVEKKEKEHTMLRRFRFAP